MTRPSLTPGTVVYRADPNVIRALKSVYDQLDQATTHAVLGGWKWWRPGFSRGRYDGLTLAADLAFYELMRAYDALIETEKPCT